MALLASRIPFKNIILGDSRSISAFKPSLLGEQYFNLSFSGSTPLEGYFTLIRLKEKKSVFDTVIVSYSPFHFVKADCFWERSLKYGFFRLADIHQIFFEMNDSRQPFWTTAEKPMSGLAYYCTVLKAIPYMLKFPSVVQPEISNSLFTRGKNNDRIYAMMRRQRGQYVFEQKVGSTHLNFETRAQDFKPKNIQLKAFDRMLELATKLSSTVIVKMAPMNQASHDILRKRYLKTLDTWLQTVRVKYPDVVFMEHIDIFDDQYFWDPNHLSDTGAEKFTAEFRNALMELSVRNIQSVK